MKRILTVVVFLVFVSVTSAQTTTAKVSLESLRFLIGDWEAAGQGGPGAGKGGFSFVFDLQNKIILRKNYAEYPATENRPATRHEDLMVIYADSATNQILASYFDTEGHQINYKVAPASDGQRVTFISDPSQSQPRYRLSYAKSKATTLNGKFEIAPPGQPEAFKTYLEWTSNKK